MPVENSENIFRILVATDNHLGYAEKDHERGNDTFNTFKEILELAQEHEVDFILLGGDLFHENKPSRQTVVKCMELIKTHCFGDKPIEFEFVSDPVTNFPHLKNPCVNFHDPNLNVAIPIFSIHGNHDDPAGLGQFCALDMLSTAGLVNYFGRAKDLNNIQISPILLEKGKAKLALYGLSAIKDDRLFRLFVAKKVTILRPAEETDSWYNIFVLHQNHVERPPTNYLPEDFLEPSLDLVIWGHEHESLINPKQSNNGFYVMQPGSSIATSLCEGEAKPKNVALLQVNENKAIKVTPLPLKTVRPFVFRNIVLSECAIDYTLGNNKLYAASSSKRRGSTRDTEASDTKSAAVAQYVEEVIKDMLEEAKKQQTGHSRQPTKPLIRLRVEYKDESEMFNICRFGHKFAETVANSDDMILFRKERKLVKKEDGTILDDQAMDNVFDSEVVENRVEDLVKQYFQELDPDSDAQLKLLSERGLAAAVTHFIDKDDRDAIKDIFDSQVNKVMDKLSVIEELNEDNLGYYVMQYKLERKQQSGREALDEQEATEALSNPNRVKVEASNADDMSCSSGESDNEPTELRVPKTSAAPTSTRGRGGRGRGSRGGRGAAAAKNSLSFMSSSSSSSKANTSNKSNTSGAKIAPIFSMSTQRSSMSSQRSSVSRSGRPAGGVIYLDDSD